MHRYVFVLASFMALGATSALAEDADALQKACFAPDALKVKAGEWHATRNPALPASNSPAPPSGAAATSIPAALRGSIRRVELPDGDKSIALTFDLCERAGSVAGYDGRVIDVLRSEGVRATLFAGGKWLQTHPERAAQLMSDPLFELANHSQTHRNLRLIDAGARNDEINAPARAYEGVKANLAGRQCIASNPQILATVAPRMTLFRFPFGACDPASLAAVNDAGLLAIQWDLSTGDPDPRLSPDAIVRSLVARAKPGSIVIAHANGRGRHTADAMKKAIPLLRAKGFTFVTVSELLARGNPVIAQRCYDSKPGDTDRYDKLLRIAKSPGRKHAVEPVKSSTPNRSKKTKWQRTAARQDG